jgi:hypothetical protein
MEIELIRTKRRLNKTIIRQMPLGYKVLCGNFKVLGYVLSIIDGETRTAIIESDKEYYTLPLDYSLSDSGLSCVRQISRRKIPSMNIELKFNSIGIPGCRTKWWHAYCTMREEALKTHIYIGV